MLIAAIVFIIVMILVFMAPPTPERFYLGYVPIKGTKSNYLDCLVQDPKGNYHQSYNGYWY